MTNTRRTAAALADATYTTSTRSTEERGAE